MHDIDALDDKIDPYRPDATIEERVDHVIGVLLNDEDPVRRYHTIQALQVGRLREVAAISLRQLRDEHGSTEAAADAVGISRQAANELLAKAGAPGAREDRATRNQPAYDYGRYLAAVRDCIDALNFANPSAAAMSPKYEQALSRWPNLESKSVQTLRMLPTLATTAVGHLKAIRTTARRPNLAGALAAQVDELGALAAEWATSRSAPELTIDEQAQVYIGYHSARAQGRRQRQDRAAVRQGASGPGRSRTESADSPAPDDDQDE